MKNKVDFAVHWTVNWNSPLRLPFSSSCRRRSVGRACKSESKKAGAHGLRSPYLCLSSPREECSGHDRMMQSVQLN